MTIDHLGGMLSHYTYESFGFVSAAEGFVMLSGFMYATTSCHKDMSLQSLAKKSWQRVGKLYRYQLMLLTTLILMTVISPLHHGYVAPDIYVKGGGATETLLYGALLLHQPSVLFLLPMYMVLSLATPLLLTAFRRGWTLPAFGVSLAIWACGQIVNPMAWLAQLSHSGVHPAEFNLLSWQLLWTIGVYAGFARCRQQPMPALQGTLAIGLAGAFALLCFAGKHELVPVSADIAWLFDKSQMRLLRVLNVISLLLLFSRALDWFAVDKRLPGFGFLGKYSLQVFCFHILALCVLKPLSWRVGGLFGPAGDVLYSLGVAGTLLLAAMGYRMYEQRKPAVKGMLFKYSALVRRQSA